MLRLLPLRGGSVTTPIAKVRAAAILAVVPVNGNEDDEIFVEVSRSSSGVIALAYGYDDGWLVRAGLTLAYGGDSATRADFECLPGDPRRLVQRHFDLLEPNINGWWRDSDVTYAWKGPRLVELATRTFKHRGQPPESQARAGLRCGDEAAWRAES